MNEPAPTATIYSRIAEIGGEVWDACAGLGHPFTAYAFLAALEEAGCVKPQTGWAPQHVVLSQGGRAIGCMPMYLKGHSQGEYIFDHGWADAYERAGGRYYPKLLVAVPFTPVTGPRLLLAPDAPAAARALLVGAGIELARRHAASSLHFNFLPEADWRSLGEQGLLLRNDQQFHWFNRGYRDFRDFLDALSSRKRKTIRKERELAQEAGLEIMALTGAEITEAHWDAFFQFYMDTGSRKWGRPYLNRRFFSLLGQAMAERVVVVMCRRQGRYIAGALNLLGEDALYGRYWGCVEDRPLLHFEVCYYQAIDYAIRRGLARVEAGAQGPHKIARGYVPVAIHSAHWIADQRFRVAVERYLNEERREVASNIEHLAEYAPYRKGERRREEAREDTPL
ncbi:MAG: N-acetyltransferase [Alphaproteobacteria bacterium]|nr:N-acetyltransferase [Alphaproteobacteria bacterium]